MPICGTNSTGRALKYFSTNSLLDDDVSGVHEYFICAGEKQNKIQYTYCECYVTHITQTSIMFWNNYYFIFHVIFYRTQCLIDTILRCMTYFEIYSICAFCENRDMVIENNNIFTNDTKLCVFHWTFICNHLLHYQAPLPSCADVPSLLVICAALNYTHIDVYIDMAQYIEKVLTCIDNTCNELHIQIIALIWRNT